MVDQSNDDRSEKVAARFASLLSGFRYCRMPERGLSRAWNAALAATTGEIVAFFDDDCTVSSDWLQHIADAFERHPDVDLVFGAVHAATHDPCTHFIPAYVPRQERVVHREASFVRTAGMGASMALRRCLLAAVGGFDVHLGAGASEFKGGLDTDISNRAIIAGHRVLLTPDIAVEHFGARAIAGGAASRLYGDYAYSCGAVDMKVLRCGHWSGLLLLIGHSLHCAMQLSALRLVRRRDADGHEWIVNYARGLLHAATFPLDRQRLLYGTQGSQHLATLKLIDGAAT